MQQLLSKQFWFSSSFQQISRADQALFVVFGTFLALAIAFRIMQALASRPSVRSRFYSRAFGGFLTFGLTGAAWAVVRWLQVPVLGIRLAAGLIGVSFAIWLWFFLWYALFRFSREEHTWQEEQVRRKYLQERN